MAALVFDHFNITSYAVLNGSTCVWPVSLSGASEWIVLLISEILGTAVVPFCFVISGILFWFWWFLPLYVWGRYSIEQNIIE